MIGVGGEYGWGDQIESLARRIVELEKRVEALSVAPKKKLGKTKLAVLEGIIEVCNREGVDSCNVVQLNEVLEGRGKTRGLTVLRKHMKNLYEEGWLDLTVDGTAKSYTPKPHLI